MGSRRDPSNTGACSKGNQGKGKQHNEVEKRQNGERQKLILLMTTAPPLKSPWGMAGKLPPLGLAYVAAALEKSGFQVEIFDNYLLERPIEEVKLEVKKRAQK